jgi:hypothetical protein
MSCPHCADCLDHGLARRIRVLQLLALIEHPDALPPRDALRLGHELLAWLDRDAAVRAAPVETEAPA